MAPTRMPSFLHPLSFVLLIGLSCTSVAAHEHHDEELPPGQVISFDPVDAILWTHIAFMILSFGVLFPIGMVQAYMTQNQLNMTDTGTIQISMACAYSNPCKLYCA